jgi:hypothetical protein
MPLMQHYNTLRFGIIQEDGLIPKFIFLQIAITDIELYKMHNWVQPFAFSYTLTTMATDDQVIVIYL